MEIDGSEDPVDEAAPLQLADGETELRHWAAPGGRGVLTNLRCVVLSHPRPLHRRIRWSVPLQEVSRLEVLPLSGGYGPSMTFHGSYGGGRFSGDGVDPTFCVLVDRTIVYIGDANPCGALQQAIDEARTSRCEAVFGHLVPFRPGAPIRGRLLTPGATDESPAPVPPLAVPSPGLDAEFLLFLAGEPFRDAVPMAETRLTAMAVVSGGSAGVETAGGHIPADSAPGQVYGRQAEIGRMVLTIAHHCGIAVKVVDVDHTGSDLPLLQRWMGPNDDLPALVRTDGTRLAGEDAMTPVQVAEFLQRP